MMNNIQLTTINNNKQIKTINKHDEQHTINNNKQQQTNKQQTIDNNINSYSKQLSTPLSRLHQPLGLQ